MSFPNPCPRAAAHSSAFARGVFAALALWLAPDSAEAQWARQSISLRPGWNAIFLEVDPSPAGCDAQFAGLPIESVWDFNPPADAPQFIQDPSTLIPGSPGWLTWFPEGHPLQGQGNLHTLRDGQAYLVKVKDTAQAFTWNVTGQPSLREATWRAGGLNFVGFRVGAQGPTFQSLFAGERGLEGQPVYSLDADGVWRPVPDLATARPQSGEAYWVRCVHPAQRTSSIRIQGASRQGIAFTDALAEQSLRIRNESPGARAITVRVLDSQAPPQGQPASLGPVPLEYHRADYAGANLAWTPLTGQIQFAALAPGQEWNLRLGARRPAAVNAASGARFMSLLEITDDLGARWIVPVQARPAGANAPFASLDAPPSPHAGLWIGEAALRAVSQVSAGNTPTPAAGEFAFRLLLHIDASGTARLLQHAYVLRKPPVTEPDPEVPGATRVAEPARAVVLTDESLIPQVIGPGEVIGRRVSSSAFSFKEPLALAGGPINGGTLSGTITIDYDDPLNPFKHLYHPDHNNLDERYEQKLPEGRESFTVQRAISLEFTGEDPLGLNPPGWGVAELGGVYRETFSGLHRNAIHVSGVFRLTRAADAPFLNQ